MIQTIVILENGRDVIHGNGGTFIAAVATSCSGDDGTEASAVAASYAVRRGARALSPRRLLACDLYWRRCDDGACKGESPSSQEIRAFASCLPSALTRILYPSCYLKNRQVFDFAGRSAPVRNAPVL